MSPPHLYKSLQIYKCGPYLDMRTHSMIMIYIKLRCLLRECSRSLVPRVLTGMRLAFTWLEMCLMTSLRWRTDRSLNTQTLAGAVAAGIQLTLQVLSCIAHIHKVAFCVASWNQSAQPPPRFCLPLNEVGIFL